VSGDRNQPTAEHALIIFFIDRIDISFTEKAGAFGEGGWGP
jgi:hypothetical protein